MLCVGPRPLSAASFVPCDTPRGRQRRNRGCSTACASPAATRTAGSGESGGCGTRGALYCWHRARATHAPLDTAHSSPPPGPPAGSACRSRGRGTCARAGKEEGDHTVSASGCKAKSSERPPARASRPRCPHARAVQSCRDAPALARAALRHLGRVPELGRAPVACAFTLHHRALVATRHVRVCLSLAAGAAPRQHGAISRATGSGQPRMHTGQARRAKI